MSEPAADTDSNAKPYSVSELAFALKRTLEDAYGFVRLRGELSKVTHHSNGHVYLTLKDERSAIDGVVWKGQVRGLSVRPEQGLEVIVTGQTTTRQGQRSRMRCRMSRITAPVGEVITPTTAGMAGSGRLRSGANRPSPASLAFSRSSWASRAPTPATSMVSMTIW